MFSFFTREGDLIQSTILSNKSGNVDADEWKKNPKLQYRQSKNKWDLVFACVPQRRQSLWILNPQALNRFLVGSLSRRMIQLIKTCFGILFLNHTVLNHGTIKERDRLRDNPPLPFITCYIVYKCMIYPYHVFIDVYI